MEMPSLAEFISKAKSKAYGFVVLNLRQAILSGEALAGEKGKALDLLVVLACHSNADKRLKPGNRRLMALTQMAAESIRQHLKHLKKIGMVDKEGVVQCVVRTNRSKASSDLIFFWKRWVHLGMWADLTHYDRMVLLWLVANSYPGPTPWNDSDTTREDYLAYCMSEKGVRCLPFSALGTKRLANIIGCGRTSIRKAIERLQQKGFIELFLEDGKVYLHNSPGHYGEIALERVYTQKTDPNHALSADTKRQLAMRRKGAQNRSHEDVPEVIAQPHEGGESPSIELARGFGSGADDYPAAMNLVRPPTTDWGDEYAI